MGKTILVSFVVLIMTASQGLGDWEPWWWPPTNDAVVTPQNPTSSDVVAITLSGDWPDSCIPNDSGISVMGNDIYFDVVRDYPPGIGCLTIITPWQCTEYIGPLSPGAYSVYARLIGDPLVPPEYTYMTNFILTDYQFVLSTDSLTVSEGGTATFTVALLNPLGTAKVTVARQSGDSDITVESGALLTFDPCNYSVPQMVTLAAAEDEDYFHGTAIIEVSAPNFLPAELTAMEADNDTPRVLYVDIDATGNNDGTSWADAFTDLQEALNTAAVVPEVNEIRVAQGLYTPAEPNGDRNTTFELNNITVKGGYAGFGEPNPDSRNIREYETILSGDLNRNDDPDFTNNDENSKKVIICKGRVILDGVTVTGGNGGSGAGIYNWPNCQLVVINCIIRNNHGFCGGAIFNNKGCNLMLSNCSFLSNSAAEHGGAIYNRGRVQLKLSNCIFSGNTAAPEGYHHASGGAIRNGHYADLTLTNCTFSGNSAHNCGAIHSESGTDLALTNCILWYNSDDSGTDESAQIHSGNIAINYCCVQGWTGALGGTCNIGADPCFAEPGYWDPNGTPADANDDFWVDGDYHLKSQAGRWEPSCGSWVKDDVTSPCIDAGNPASPIGYEPFPNGGIINMGAYGGAAEASKSYFGEPVCETIVAGDINGDCKVNFLDFRLMALHWLEYNSP